MLKKLAILSTKVLRRMTGAIAGWTVAVAILAAVGITGMAVTDVRGEEPKLTPEQIMKTNPDLYRAIQEGPRLPPPEVDPNKPYDPYPGFFSQPVLKPGQIEEWWETSSFEYSPVYPYFLKHIHLKFSGAQTTGNYDGNALNGGILLALRKNRVTNTIGYTIDRKKLTGTDNSTTDKDLQGFEEILQYELNRHLFVEAGLFWQRMSYFYISNRYVPFVAAGSYNVLQNFLDKRKDSMKVTFGIANVRDEYYPTIITKLNKDSDSFNAFYFSANYIHKFSKMLTYRMDYTLKHAIDATPVYAITSIPQLDPGDQKAVQIGTTRRYDWNLANSLEFALNEYVGFLLSYTMAYDSNPWPIAAKQDTEFMAGVKFAY